MRSATAKKIGRDKPYKAWIKTLPCAVFEARLIATGLLDILPCQGDVQPHHAGIRGMSQTAHDRTLVPLCSAHHDRRMPHSVHALGVCFWAFHGLDKEKVLADLNARYETNREAA